MHENTSRLTPSPEERLNLEISIESQAFLKNIIEYGKNRMARRAIGLLQKMPAYKLEPTELHYSYAIWACENSLQYSLGVSVFEEMMLKEVPRSEFTYEALISLAERTNYLSEALQYFTQMKDIEGMSGTTQIYNSILIVTEKLKDLKKANEVFEEMSKNQIRRDIVTYTAMIAVCEKGGNSMRAMEIFELLEREIERQQKKSSNIILDSQYNDHESLPTRNNTNIINAAEQDGAFLAITAETVNRLLWTFVKDREPRQAIKLFQLFSEKARYPYFTADLNTYNAIIWACDMLSDGLRAEGYLTMMKMKHIRPQTMSYDGVISAYARQNQYEPILNLMKCMTAEEIPKSPITYQLAIDCLDRQSNENQDILISHSHLKSSGSSISSSSNSNHFYFNYINEIYFSALRDGYFNPWIKGSRQLDLRGFLFSVCKVAVKSILLSMLEKKLSVFTLEMIVAEETSGEIVSSFDIDLFYDYLTSLHLFSSGENSLFVSSSSSLQIQKRWEGPLLKFVIHKESLETWLDAQD